jgi:hypothetical protein
MTSANHALFMMVFLVLIKGCFPKKSKTHIASKLSEVQEFCELPETLALLNGQDAESKKNREKSIAAYQAAAQRVYYKLLLDRVYYTSFSSRLSKSTSNEFLDFNSALNPISGKCSRLVEQCGAEGGASSHKNCKEFNEFLMANAEIQENWKSNFIYSTQDAADPSDRECFVGVEESQLTLNQEELKTTGKALDEACSAHPLPWLENFFSPAGRLDAIATDSIVASRAFEDPDFDSDEFMVGYCVLKKKVKEDLASLDSRDSKVSWIQAGTSVGLQLATLIVPVPGGAVAIDWGVFALAVQTNILRLLKLHEQSNKLSVATQTSQIKCRDGFLEQQNQRIYKLIAADVVGQLAGLVMAQSLPVAGRMVSKKYSSLFMNGLVGISEKGLKVAGNGQLLPLPPEAMNRALEVISGIVSKAKNDPAVTEKFLFGLKKALELSQVVAKSQVEAPALKNPQMGLELSQSASLFQLARTASLTSVKGISLVEAFSSAIWVAKEGEFTNTLSPRLYNNEKLSQGLAAKMQQIISSASGSNMGLLTVQIPGKSGSLTSLKIYVGSIPSTKTGSTSFFHVFALPATEDFPPVLFRRVLEASREYTQAFSEKMGVAQLPLTTKKGKFKLRILASRVRKSWEKVMQNQQILDESGVLAQGIETTSPSVEAGTSSQSQPLDLGSIEL